jgi:ATP-dependent RNA helicase DDX41
MSRKRKSEEEALEKFMEESKALGLSTEATMTAKQRQQQLLQRASGRHGYNNDSSNGNGGLASDSLAMAQLNRVSGGEQQSAQPSSLLNQLDPTLVAAPRENLMRQAMELRKMKGNLDAKSLKQIEQEELEATLLREANTVTTNALQSNEQIAAGVDENMYVNMPGRCGEYGECIATNWTAPAYFTSNSDFNSPAYCEQIRNKYHILVEGERCPPPIDSFVHMKIPQCIIDKLSSDKGIEKPSPIQIQALPALFSGRDVIGIAFTGSGKTLTFVLPMLMLALTEEMNCPLERQEGPLGVVLAPSRELARQTLENLEFLTDCLSQSQTLNRQGVLVNYPQIRSTLIIGGEDKRVQTETFQKFGVHCIVATPGRLNDLLKKNQLNMDICKYFALDEGDRMLDMGFDEEVHSIINKFKRAKQTVLFSATMPQKFQTFAKNTLIKPILVNVGRAGAASLDIVQEVEFVSRENKILYLLEVLQKTAPPVIIFSEKKQEVDEIHEYLLLKGIDACSIHGGKDQAERNDAIASYKAGKKDVLVANDIAAKGLDFPDIQHVINYDMPTEIENYVHRIGRTGRRGRTGIATTFINRDDPESALLDLKALLLEAKQRIPPILQELADPDADINGIGGVEGCAFCGGLGHRITNCPKLEKDSRKISSNKRDSLAGSGW